MAWAWAALLLQVCVAKDHILEVTQEPDGDVKRGGSALIHSGDQSLEEVPMTFNCVDQNSTLTVKIIMDQKPEVPQTYKAPTAETIRTHIGDPNQLKWVPIKEQYFSDIDGRTEEKILGTPGGDLAEFILALNVLQTEAGFDFDQEYVYDKLKEYILGMSKTKFYWQTTDVAHKCLMDSLDAPINIVDPPEDIQELLLDRIIEPQYVGNDHVRWMLEDPGLYRSERATAELVLRAYHTLLWNRTWEGTPKMQYVMLKGEHKERALLNVEAPDCLAKGLAPVISTQGCGAEGTSVFNIGQLGGSSLLVVHVGAVGKYRAELAAFFAKEDEKMQAKMLKKMNMLGTFQLAKTSTRLVQNYPVYTAIISKVE